MTSETEESPPRFGEFQAHLNWCLVMMQNCLGTPQNVLLKDEDYEVAMGK